MPPKTPDELREQLEKQATEKPAREGRDRTAEGVEVPTPSRQDFLSNLERVTKPDEN
jgi:hypothetical protein